LRSSAIRITVIEGASQPLPGVLATEPSIVEFHQHLGVKEVDLMRHVGAAYCYGHAYSGWTADRPQSVFSYSPSGSMIDRVDFHHYITRLRQSQPQVALESFSLTAAAGRAQRFSHPQPGTPYAQIQYAIRFDRIGYRQFLKAYAIDQGVQCVAATVRKADRDPETGDILALQLDDGQRIEADFYFDSTGDEATLISGQLDSGYEAWDSIFPCDTRLELMCRSAAETSVLDTIEHAAYGWRRDLALPGAIYQEHCFRSGIDSEDAILSNARDRLPAKAEIAWHRIARQRPGRRLEFWRNNCVAIGESAGFAEQFMFGPFYQTQTAVERWLALLPDHPVNPHLQREYNRATREEYERIRDAHALHVLCAQRTRAPFWRALSEESEWPETLRYRLQLFLKIGKSAFYEADPLSPQQWAMLMTCFGVLPERYDPLIAEISVQTLAERLSKIAEMIETLVANMPRHDDLLMAIRRSAPDERSRARREPTPADR
jgi:tryptophan 7-halogenase